MDDGDFTIPDYHHLSPEDQESMWNLSPVLKERFQRMVIFYHLDILARYDDCILGGFHIEEKIRSEEHTSELQSLVNLVCRLLLEKKKIIYKYCL